MAYIVDISKLVMSNGNPDDFFLYHYPDASGNKRLVPINKVLFRYDNSNKQNIIAFADTNGNSHDSNTKYISGTVRTSENLWESTESLTAYTKSSMPEFVARGTHPQFKQKLIDLGPGNYTLKMNSNQTCFEIGNSSLTVNLFKDGILPDRILLIMQAGGGGGGGIGECALAYANDAGGGGGSGAWFAVILNTKLVKEGHSFKFTVGDAGKAGKVYLTSDTSVHADPSTPGGTSILKFHNNGNNTDYVLLQALGGGAGDIGKSAKAGAGGSAGKVINHLGQNLLDGYDGQFVNSWWWWCPYSHGRSYESGVVGNNGGKNQPDYTDTYINPNGYSVFSTFDTTYQSGINKYALGNYHNGLRYAADKQCGGAGAASWFGNGGDGGWWANVDNCKGKPGDGYGSGGGGGTFYAYEAEMGGDGTPGHMWLYY